MIELLVVVGIILVLSTLALLITPRFADDQRTSRGADQVQGWIFIAKQRAYRDQVPRGVRLVRNAANPNWVSEIVYIERPESITGTHVLVPAQPGQYNTAFVSNVDWKTNDVVLPGDFFQLNQYETAPYNVHRIFQVDYPVTIGGQQGTLLTLAAVDSSPSNIGGNIDGNTSTKQLFQIIRQPRPMAGESPLYLPKNVVIDLDPATEGTSILPGINPTDPWYDILFTERGQVTGLPGTVGKVVLRVRPSDRPASAASIPPGNIVYDNGEQILIAIYTRTGTIAAYHLNLDLNPNPNPSATPPVPVLRDAYQWVRTGGSTGL